MQFKNSVRWPPIDEDGHDRRCGHRSNGSVRVEWAMMTRWQPDRDTVLLTEQKGSSLDPSRSEDGTTAKIGIDATIPFGADRSGFTIQG